MTGGSARPGPFRLPVAGDTSAERRGATRPRFQPTFPATWNVIRNRGTRRGASSNWAGKGAQGKLLRCITAAGVEGSIPRLCIQGDRLPQGRQPAGFPPECLMLSNVGPEAGRAWCSVVRDTRVVEWICSHSTERFQCLWEGFQQRGCPSNIESRRGIRLET